MLGRGRTLRTKGLLIVSHVDFDAHPGLESGCYNHQLVTRLESSRPWPNDLLPELSSSAFSFAKHRGLSVVGVLSSTSSCFLADTSPANSPLEQSQGVIISEMETWRTGRAPPALQRHQEHIRASFIHCTDRPTHTRAYSTPLALLPPLTRVAQWRLLADQPEPELHGSRFPQRRIGLLVSAVIPVHPMWKSCRIVFASAAGDVPVIFLTCPLAVASCGWRGAGDARPTCVQRNNDLIVREAMELQGSYSTFSAA